MHKIIMPRGGGKTTKLITISAMTGQPIVCGSPMHAEHIEKMARESGKEIPKPIFLYKGWKEDMLGKGIRKVLVDNLDDIVKGLIRKEFGQIDIDTATFTDDTIIF